MFFKVWKWGGYCNIQSIYLSIYLSNKSKQNTSSYKYFAMKFNSRVEVCRKAYMSLHSIDSNKIVERLTRLVERNLEPIDNRGKHTNRGNVLDPLVLNKIAIILLLAQLRYRIIQHTQSLTSWLDSVKNEWFVWVEVSWFEHCFKIWVLLKLFQRKLWLPIWSPSSGRMFNLWWAQHKK